jgi:hypothetical protein
MSIENSSIMKRFIPIMSGLPEMDGSKIDCISWSDMDIHVNKNQHPNFEINANYKIQGPIVWYLDPFQNVRNGPNVYNTPNVPEQCRYRIKNEQGLFEQRRYSTVTTFLILSYTSITN